MSSPEISLKPFGDADSPVLFALVDANRPQLQKFWWEAATQNADDSRRFIQAVIADEDYDGRPTRGIWLQDRLIGVGSVHSIDWELGSAALGYWIDKDHQGNGYATETVRQLSQLAFNVLGLRTVTISCRANNFGSRSVAEKAGFRLAGVDGEATWRAEQIEGEIAHYKLIVT